MPKAHDRAIVRLGGDLEFARQRFPLDDQRVIASSLEFLRQAAKNRFAVVFDAARFSVHLFVRSNHAAAKRRTNCLMAQANGKNWNFAREEMDQGDGDSRFLR